MFDPSFFAGKKCLVTGGASFIGSHLVDSLVGAGAEVAVVDDLSSGSLDNLGSSSAQISFAQINISDKNQLKPLLDGVEIVFHLAAIHGGRGYIETFPSRVLENLSLDWILYSACEEAGVSRVVHASSACVYPIGLQDSAQRGNQLEERSAGFEAPSQSFPDGAYGWVKLMGEYQLQQICEASQSMTGRSARIFTAYGSRENESHAAVALWAKAALRVDPYPVWGDGTQTRNFTHVSDTVMGLLLLGSDARDIPFDAVNVGSSVHYSVNEFIEEVFVKLEWRPRKIEYQLNRPVGVKSRASDNSKVLSLFGWEPKVTISEGIVELGEWYQANRLSKIGPERLEALLLER